MQISRERRAVLLGSSLAATVAVTAGALIFISRGQVGDNVAVGNDPHRQLIPTADTVPNGDPVAGSFLALVDSTATTQLGSGGPPSTLLPAGEPELPEPGLSPDSQRDRDPETASDGGGQGYGTGRDLDGAPLPRRDTSGAVPAPPNAGPLTNGQPGAAKPLIAVKIDNAPGSRPHAGINQADIVFELLVEGGISRFMALFQSDEAAVVGPVRSARTTDLNLLSMMNRPVFAWSGANDAVREALGNVDIVDVGAENTGGTYYRSSGREIPHNLMTSTAALTQAAIGRGARVPRPLFGYEAPGGPTPAGASNVDGIEIAVGSTTSAFWWDGGSQRWLRDQGGTAHTDSQGYQIAPTNVVVLETDYLPSPADARSPEAQTVGQGRSWVLTGGRAVTGTWLRMSPSGTYQLFSPSGQPLKLNPGRTWVSLPTPGGSVRLLGATPAPETTTTTTRPATTTTRPATTTTTTSAVATTVDRSSTTTEASSGTSTSSTP